MDSAFPEGPTAKNTDTTAIALTKLLELFRNAVDENGYLRITGQAINFLDLGDAPKTYAGQGGYLVRVNTAENALEFFAPNYLSQDALDDLLGEPSGIATLGIDGKLTNGQIPQALLGATKFMGVWDATANTTVPDLGSLSTPRDVGQYWIVTVPGATDLSGITDWKLGDWALSVGTQWWKVDNTDAVVTVCGKTGIVTLDIGDITGLTSALSGKQDTLPSGNALQVLRRNATNTGLEFADAAAGGGGVDVQRVWMLTGI